MLEGELLKWVKCVRFRSDCALSDSVSGRHHEWVFYTYFVWIAFAMANGLFTLPDSDSDSDSDSCTMQKFHIGSDPDSDPLIEVHGIGTDICPWDGHLSLKWVQ